VTTHEDPTSAPPRTIPTFLSIDVEPDGFQLSPAEAGAWKGYTAMLEFSEQLRAKLTASTETPPRFGWHFRTDPQIADVYGRAHQCCSRLRSAHSPCRERGLFRRPHASDTVGREAAGVDPRFP